MAMLELIRATAETWEEAYDVFYRALRKLMTEGRSEFFGGMTPDRVKNSMKEGNEVFLIYRKHDPMPVAAVSILRLQEQMLHEGDRERMEEFLEEQEFNPDEIRILNAMSVRPELWGQGYGRQALRLCKDYLKKEEGVKGFIGEYHPDDDATFATMKYVAAGNKVLTGEEYVWPTPKGRQLPRRRFAFAPSD